MWEAGDQAEKGLTKKDDVWAQGEQRLQSAGAPPPPGNGDGPKPEDTFRFYDMKLGGELRTHVERPDASEPEAVAMLHARDGSVREVGRLRYAMDLEHCTLRAYTHPPETYQVESALQAEVSEQAQAKNIHNMRAWVPDGTSPKVWSPYGLMEGKRDPGASGAFWSRPL